MTGEILVQRYGQQQWIMQVMEAVQNAVQNGIEQLSGTMVAHNEMPIQGSGDYRFRARTREELIASQQLAAESRHVDPRQSFRQLQDPARKFGNVRPEDLAERHPDEVRSPSGLILPRGAQQQQQEQQHVEQPTVERPGDGPVSWLL